MQNQKRIKNLDINNFQEKSFFLNKEKIFSPSSKNTSFSILFSKGRKSQKFFTEDSKLYITPRETELLEKGVKLDRRLGKWDNISSKIVSEYEVRRMKKAENDFLVRKLKAKMAELGEDMEKSSRTFFGQFSVARLWNVSIAASILFGMFSMTMIYRYLGQGASAGNVAILPQNEAIERSVDNQKEGLEKEAEEYTMRFLENSEKNEEKDLEKEIAEMVKGYPIEEMIPYIAEKDRTVAAFLIGIAKKESNWGKRVPLLNEQDCYNYWGYRGIRKLMGTGGHTCFNSRKDAVDTVAKRIKWLIENEELDTPKEMVVWKCGNNCAATGGQAAANKWIEDVNKYFEKLNAEDK